MINAVFCDFHGTIVHDDDEPLGIILKKMMESGTAASRQDIEAFWLQSYSALVSTSFGDNFKLAREMFSLSIQETITNFGIDGDAEELGNPQFKYWREPRIFPDGRAFLNDCHLPVYIISNVDSADMAAALESLNIKVAGFVTSEQARAYKPRPEIFTYALKKYGFDSSEVVLIGDSLSGDIAGARAVGIQTIWLNRKGRTIPEGVDKHASDLREALEML